MIKFCNPLSKLYSPLKGCPKLIVDKNTKTLLMPDNNKTVFIFTFPDVHV